MVKPSLGDTVRQQKHIRRRIELERLDLSQRRTAEAGAARQNPIPDKSGRARVAGLSKCSRSASWGAGPDHPSLSGEMQDRARIHGLGNILCAFVPYPGAAFI